MRGEDSLGSFRRDKEGEAVLVTDSFLVGSGDVLEEPETVLAWNENRLTSEPELVRLKLLDEDPDENGSVFGRGTVAPSVSIFVSS